MAKRKLLNPYAVLGVTPSANADQIHKAYIALARQVAPRMVGDPEEAFKALAFAYSQIKTEEGRKKYQTHVELLKLQCPGCAGTGVTYRSVSFILKEEVKCEACQGTGRID